MKINETPDGINTRSVQVSEGEEDALCFGYIPVNPVGKTRSQHFRGQAVDIQFRNASKKEYYERAKIIKNLVPYDQFLLEFKNTGTGLPWIHISFSFDSNRGQVLTFFNHKVASSGLVQLA